jgi:MFS transporter, DHA1 family, tetracycline resistance protein
MFMTNDADYRQSLRLVAFIVFIDTAGVGLIIPVMPSLITQLGDVSIDRAAEIGGWLLFAFAVMQFLFAPIIGGLSDRFGRRPVLLFTLAALGLDYLLMAWAPSLAWLFVGRMISGAMGATWAAANSCIADAVPADQRGAAFGMLGGAGAAGFVMGPAIGGVIGLMGDRLPFVAAASLCFATVAIGYFQLIETLPADKRRRFDLSRANPLGAVRQMARLPFVAGCLIMLFFLQLAAQATFAVWGYYGALKFGWTPATIGWTVALYGLLLVVAQGFVVARANARFGPARTALWGMLFALPSYLIIALAGNTAVMVVAILVGSIGGLVFPSLQSLMTRAVAEDAQGELQGAIASIVGLTAIIGPPLMAGVFGAYSDAQGAYFPGAPFLLAFALMGVSWLVLALTLRRAPD